MLGHVLVTSHCCDVMVLSQQKGGRFNLAHSFRNGPLVRQKHHGRAGRDLPAARKQSPGNQGQHMPVKTLHSHHFRPHFVLPSPLCGPFNCDQSWIDPLIRWSSHFPPNSIGSHFLRLIIYVCECFGCMCVCLPPVCLVLNVYTWIA